MHEGEGWPFAISPPQNIIFKLLPTYSLWISSQLFLMYTTHAGRCFQHSSLDISCSSQQLNSQGLEKEELTEALISDTSKTSKLILSQETRMTAVEKLKAQETLALKDRDSQELKLADVNFYP